ncbi:PEP-CTERM sorting domain-containing protein [Pseudoduganella lutea]|nr:PEP-CTERM sorting domain-containing protein [Pseudoduganella lutea]
MRIVPVLLLSAVVAMPAQAAIVTYQFTANVSGLTEHPGGTEIYNNVESSSSAGPTISVGDTWTGTVSWNTDLTLGSYQPEQPEQASYRLYEGFMGATITDAQTGLSYSSDADLAWLALMQVHDGVAGAESDFLSIGTHASGAGFESGDFFFFNYDGSSLSGDAPPASLNFADYFTATVSYSFLDVGTENWMQANANITSLTLVTAPVPEPSTYAMLGLGLAALAMTKKLRRA